jgi:isoleucyl-tRNA synthetase
VEIVVSPQNQVLGAEEWAEVAIVSKVEIKPMERFGVTVDRAAGEKCARCWRVLEEVGSVAAHPTLCLRCADAVDSGLVCAAAA